MAWTHCGETLLDDVLACPECGEAKEKWTLRFDRTRVFTLHKGWITLELLDEEGKPLADHPYVITLPDGSVREGNLDEDGVVHVQGLNPGMCTLQLPGLGEHDLKLEDVEPELEPPPGWIEVVVEDEQGRPVPDLECKLEDAEGNEHEGVLDAYGVWRVEGIVEGRAKLTLAGCEAGDVVVRENRDVRASTPAEPEWIEFWLQDDQGRALAGQAYRLELKEGEPREGKTNEHGMVREFELPPGGVSLCFPDLDMRDVTVS